MLASKDECDKICLKGSRRGRVYGNPKIHKQAVDNLSKFRPILPAINTLGYNSPILEPLTHNEFTVKDSFRFAKDITTYGSSLYMAGLDVESLFTNIPLKETINIYISDLPNKNLYNGNLIKRHLLKLLEKATSKSTFILITCFINKLTEWQWFLLWVSSLQMHFHVIMKKNGWIIVQSTLNLPIYKRYVDDIFGFFS